MDVTEFKYDLKPVDKGYNNRTLYINLAKNEIRSKPVSQEMKTRFTGGRGFCLWLLWKGLPKDRVVEWDDPENEICIASGPLGGIPTFPGSGKSIVTTISPLTGIPIDSNVGGYFGPYLKFSGWDALEIQGRANYEVIIFIDGDTGKVTIEDATELPSETHLLGELLTKRLGGADKSCVSVVSAGPGAEHSLMGCLSFSWYDSSRKTVRYKQAGRGGTGTVLRNKKIKALVARFSKPITASINNPADPARVDEVGRAYNKEIRSLDPQQNQMAVKGSSYLVAIMDHFDLLPVNNFRYGGHPEALKISGEEFAQRFDKGFDGCWIGCSMSCSHCLKGFELKTGPHKGKRVLVDGPEYETIAGLGSNCGIFDQDYIAEANYYCDTYGIDTISLGTAMAFAMECYETGLINKTVTEGLTLSFGDKDSALTLIHQMARGEGFGGVLGQGIRKMKKLFAESYGADPSVLADIGMEAKGLEYSEYVTKESLAQQGGYGLALKGPQHDEAWLIFLDQVNRLLPTFEQKGEALYWFPMFRTWFGLNGLCKLPWNDVIPEGNRDTPEPAKVMLHVENYAKLFSAVTGRSVTPDDLVKMSEKVYNFQRVFNIRMGFGRRKDDNIPYRSVGPVTKEEYESRAERYDKQLRDSVGIDPSGLPTERKMAMLRRHRESEYERLKDAVYKRRGWTTEGIPKLGRIVELGIDYPEVVSVIEKVQGKT